MPPTFKKSWYPNMDIKSPLSCKFSGSPGPKHISGMDQAKKSSLAGLSNFMGGSGYKGSAIK